MARPITWQDVAAPNTAGSLAAAQAASTQIQNALTGIGQVGTNYIDDTRKAATEQAVAGILNSADPLAAAAAAPQGWQVDALALQKAALGQDQVNRQNKASDASLAASEIATKTNQAQFDDIISNRNAEAIAQRNYDASEKANKVTFTGEDEGGTGQDYVKAGAIIQGRLKDRHDQLNDDKRLGLEQQRLNLEKKKLDKENYAQNLRDYNGAMYSFGLSPQGALLDPADRANWAETMAEQYHVSAAESIAGLQQFDLGLANNKPNKADLSNEVKTADGKVATVTERDADGKIVKAPLTYGKTVGVLSQAREAALTEIELAKANESGKLGYADLTAKSPYAGVDRGTIITDLGTKLNDAPGDIDQQMNAFQSKARELGGEITDAQAALLVTRLNGNKGWGVVGDSLIAGSDDAIALVQELVKFNKQDGVAGLDRRIDLATSKPRSQLSAIERDIQTTQAASQIGAPIAKSAANRAADFSSHLDEVFTAEDKQKAIDEAARIKTANEIAAAALATQRRNSVKLTSQR